MAAGTPGAAAGKSLVAAPRPEAPPVALPAVARAGRKAAGDDSRPIESRAPARQGASARDGQRLAAQDAAERRDDAASAAHEAAASADNRAQVRAQGAADAADRRTAFSAALDKARAPSRSPQQAGPAQAGAPDPAQAAAQQAAQATEAGAGATAAEVASLALHGGAGGKTQDSTAGIPDRRKTDAVPGGDSLEAAHAAVASLLGWLQPVLPVTGKPSAAGDGAGGGGEAPGGSQGTGIDDVGSLRGVQPADASALGASGGAQAGALQPAALADGQVRGNAPDAQGLAVASQASLPGDPVANAAAAKADDPSAGAVAYATRYVEAKGATAASAGGNGVPSPGFDASQSMRTGAAAVAAPVERSVPAPMGDRHWARALSTQVLLLANHKVESATLRLSPEHTGPVEVRIQLQDSGVTLAFNATQADTRAALEQALPQLRAAFAGAGLALGQATVGQQMRQGSQFAHATPNGTASVADHPEATAAVVRPLGLLDEYA